MSAPPTSLADTPAHALDEPTDGGRRTRPSAMVFTCLLALVVTGNVGMWLELSGNKEALAQQQSRELDEQVRRELRSLGWAPPSSPALQSLSAALHTSHGVELLSAGSEFELGLDNGTVSGSPPSDDAMSAATLIAFDELSLLPRGLLERIGLRRVVMISGLREARRPIPSLPNYRGTLLLDVDAKEPFLRRLLQHEIFHFVDLADDGILQFDERWQVLNPAGFRYGAGGRSMRARDAGTFNTSIPGFVTRYATSAIEEDKAELFSFMMTEPSAVEELARRDQVIASKHRQMRAMLSALSDDVDDAFWLRVERARGH